MTCYFQQCGILTSVDTDEPVQPPFKFRNSKKLMLFGQKLNTHIIFKRLVKALIRLRVCTGWSEPLLVTHTCTTLLEISCRGSLLMQYISAEKLSTIMEQRKGLLNPELTLISLASFLWDVGKERRPRSDATEDRHCLLAECSIKFE